MTWIHWYGGDDMKYIFLLEVDNKVKPFEEASPQELEALNDKVK